jgi:hypothetical protein
VQKPGGFARYKYRDELFPTLTFRRTYDALTASLGEWDATVDYLKILHLAASTMEEEVEVALALILDQGQLPRIEAVKSLINPSTPEIPEMPAYKVDLRDYDTLIQNSEEVI